MLDVSIICIDETSAKDGNVIDKFAEQSAKRRARDYRNIKNFMNMIFFDCGKLKFNYPLKTT